MKSNASEIKFKSSIDFVDVAYGWLSPDGVFYPVGYHEHCAFAVSIGKYDEFELERAGWVALRGCYWDTKALDRPSEYVTQAQYSVIYDWFEINNNRQIITVLDPSVIVSNRLFNLIKTEGD